MAPNMSGMKQVDQPRSVYLVELALDMAEQVLKPGGSLVCKCFEGEGIEDLRAGFRKRFKRSITSNRSHRETDQERFS